MMTAVPREHRNVYLMHGPSHEADMQHAITAPEYAARCNKAGNMPAAALSTVQCISEDAAYPKGHCCFDALTNRQT